MLNANFLHEGRTDEASEVALSFSCLLFLAEEVESSSRLHLHLKVLHTRRMFSGSLMNVNDHNNQEDAAFSLDTPRYQN